MDNDVGLKHLLRIIDPSLEVLIPLSLGSIVYMKHVMAKFLHHKLHTFTTVVSVVIDTNDYFHRDRHFLDRKDLQVYRKCDRCM